MTILVALASLTLAVAIPRPDRIELSLGDGEKDAPVPQEFNFSPDAQTHVGALGSGGLEAARPAAPVQASESRIDFSLPQPTATAAGSIEVRNISRTILEGPNLPENLIIKGAGSVGTTGAVGAVDRITHEILLSLDERPTLVAWLFDESGSLKPQREAIAKRFDRIYKELGVIEKSGKAAAFKQHDQPPLLTSISEFGEKFDFITPKPVDDLSAIKSAVRLGEGRPERQRKYVSSDRRFGRKVPSLPAGVAAPKRDDCRVYR